MKNKRFASLFLASMMALQLATPLSAYQQTETQSTAEETTPSSEFNGMMRIHGFEIKDFVDDVSVPANDLSSTILTNDDATTLFEKVSDNSTDYLSKVTGTTGYADPTHNDYTFKGWVDSTGADWVFATDVTSGVNPANATALDSATPEIYAVWAERTLESIAVETAPTKVTYQVDDPFDATGLVITLTYDNGVEEEVTYSDGSADFGFTVDKGTIGSLTTESTSVTITYKGEVLSDTITIKVTAADPVITGIALDSTSAHKTEYTTGGDFVPDGLVIKVTYSDASTATVTYDDNTSMFAFEGNTNLTTSGDITVKYTVDSKTYTCLAPVTVSAPTITGIALDNTTDHKTAYTTGGDFVPDGLVIKVTYSNNTTATVAYDDNESMFTFEDNTNLTASGNVTVKYTVDSTTYTCLAPVTVSLAAATSITTAVVSSTSAHATTYTVGDVFSLAGLVLDVTYDNGTTDKVTYNTNASSFSVTTAPDLSTTGTKTVTVTYKDSNNLSKEFTYTITVEAAPIPKYTVSFYTNKDDTLSADAESVEEGKLATIPTYPNKTGYKFEGWFDASTDKLFDFATPINADTNLYATWSINKYVVKFDLAGGTTTSSTSDQTLDYNSTLTALAEPTKDGYDFNGWKYKEGTTDKGTFTFGADGTKITADITVYATWEVKGIKSIVIKQGTFAYEVGDSLKTSDLVITATYEDDTTAEVPYNSTDFTLDPTPSTLLNTSHDLLTVTYGGKKDTKAISVTYPEGTTTYTVTFKLDGGSVGELTSLPSRVIKAGDPVESFGAAPTKAGHVFLGWFYLDSTNNQQKFEFKDIVTSATGTPVNSNIEVYATWASDTDAAEIKVTVSPKSAYTMEDLFDPTGLQISVTSSAGNATPVIYSETTASLFDFSPGLDIPLQLSDEKVTITYGGVSVDFPITVSKKQFTVTFDSQYGYVNGSQTVPSVTVVDGSFDVPDPGKPERDGYDFLGWYYAPEGSGETLFVFEKTAITSDIKIYAKWAESENPLVKVEFITNTHTVFIEGETFNPAGLVMKLTYEDGEVKELLYGTSNAESFKFTPSLDTPLTMEDKKVVFTYADFDVEYTIPITVNEDDRWVSGIVRDYYEELVSGAILSFRQNNVEKYTATTDGSGVYSLQNLEAGTYTVVTTFGNRTTTNIITITGNSQTLNTIYLPQSQTSTSILATSLVPFVQVSNIDAVAAELSVGESIDTLVKIDLEITNNYPATDVEYMEAYKSTNEILGAFFDISLYKSLVFSEDSNTGRMPVSETATLMEIVLDLPTELQGKGTYYVYRMHDGVMERLSATANDAGEKINLNSSKDQIVITTRNFSTYAIAYKEVADSDDDNYYDGYVGSDRYTITTNKIVNGVPTRQDIGGSIYLSTLYPIHNTKVTVSLTPYLGFVVDYITATDAYGNNVSVFLESEGVYTFNQGGSEVVLDVAFRNIPIPTSPDGYTGFYDVNEGDWYYLTVLTAANLELMVGKGYGIFEPNATTTRAEIVQVLYNLAGSPQVDTISTFSDVLGYEWYYHAVNWAQSIGLVEGYGDSTFRPNQAISREELSSMFFAYAQTDPSITPILWPFTVEYSDHDSISPWALESVRWGTNKGLFSGKTGNFFGPQDAATRAEVAHCLLAITDRAVL